jgi:hypothetical protein
VTTDSTQFNFIKSKCLHGCFHEIQQTRITKIFVLNIVYLKKKKTNRTPKQQQQQQTKNKQQNNNNNKFK